MTTHINNTFNVKPLITTFKQQIIDRIDQKTKPNGALGQLEDLAIQLALIFNQSNSMLALLPKLTPSMLIFAAEHGIAKQGVSIAPSDVTRQMVLNFLSGGAAINCICRSNMIPLTIIDSGICAPITTDERAVFNLSSTQPPIQYIEQRLGQGTEDFSIQPAMTAQQVQTGLTLGKSIVLEHVLAGKNLILLGEMGIGNTSSAAAILSCVLSKSALETVGQGTGISAEQKTLKQQLVQCAIKRTQKRITALSNSASTTQHEHETMTQRERALVILEEVAGFEIVQMVGAIIGAAQSKTPVMIDGYIVSAAALIACELEPNCREYLIFSHQSDEHAHKMMLNFLHAKPLLNMSLRLGEGTGSALAFPLLPAAIGVYNDMASLSDMGIEVETTVKAKDTTACRNHG